MSILPLMAIYLSTIVEVAVLHHNLWMQTIFVCHLDEQCMHTIMMIFELVMLVLGTCLMQP